jgi:hypothetical protein
LLCCIFFSYRHKIPFADKSCMTVKFARLASLRLCNRGSHVRLPHTDDVTPAQQTEAIRLGCAVSNKIDGRSRPHADNLISSAEVYEDLSSIESISSFGQLSRKHPKRAGRSVDGQTRKSKWLVLNWNYPPTRGSELLVLPPGQPPSRRSKWPVLNPLAVDTCPPSPG